jgi:NAD(P)-dependent dehydrogenase (short-subunit alcohol dehydrogenase family)
VLDLKDRRIRVNAISPGVIETAGLADLFGGGDQAEAPDAVQHRPRLRLGWQSNRVWIRMRGPAGCGITVAPGDSVAIT